MDLSIIIVNWNSGADAVECISSLRASLDTLVYEIVVVDNASSDDSCQLLEQKFPLVKLIRSGENLGFARGNNLGFLRSTGRTILFLNPDTKVLGKAIQAMYAALQSSERIGAVGCKLLNRDLTLQTCSIHRFPTIVNELLNTDWLKRCFPQLGIWGIEPLFDGNGRGSVMVEAVPGTCLLVKRNVFERVRLFSTDYFMYGEDLDLCYKIRRVGYEVHYVGDASVIHYGGQSTRKRKDDGFQHVVMRQSVFTFLEKWRGRGYASLYRVAMGASATARLSVLGLRLLIPSASVNRDRIRTAFRKWCRVLTWSLGLEQWAQGLGNTASSSEAVVKG